MLARVIVLCLLLAAASGADAVADLLACTYLGDEGKDGQYETPMVIAGDGTVYIAGRTRSQDFPTSTGAAQEDWAGGTDIFVARLSGDLTTRLAATYLGGSGDDGDWPGVDLVLDDQGNVYVTGKTQSSDFPTTDGVYDRVLDGGVDVFISKLSADLSTLMASTLLGGSAGEYFSKVRIDGAGDVIVVATTGSGDFPTPGIVADSIYNGGGPGTYPGDVFVAKLTPDLTSLQAATYVGGSGSDYCEGVEFDSEGNKSLS